jgi:hypothetical protein
MAVLLAVGSTVVVGGGKARTSMIEAPGVIVPELFCFLGLCGGNGFGAALGRGLPN